MSDLAQQRWRQLAAEALACATAPAKSRADLMAAAKLSRNMPIGGTVSVADLWLFGSLREVSCAFAHAELARRLRLAPALHLLADECLAVLDPRPPIAAAATVTRFPYKDD